jgi:hypothetical protein
MHRTLAALTCLLLGANAAAATTVLECDRLIDVENGRLLEDRQIRIDDQRIAAVGRAVEAPDDGRRIRLGTCLPGLMDMHVHLNGQMARDSYMKEFQSNEADLALTAAHYAGPRRPRDRPAHLYLGQEPGDHRRACRPDRRVPPRPGRGPRAGARGSEQS